MTPIQAVTSVLRNARNFSGRATRPEFWWFALVALVMSVIAAPNPAVSWIVNLVLVLLSLAVGVRRLHDTGRSGGWITPLFIPIVGFPVSAVLAFTDLWAHVFLVGFLSVLIVMAAILAGIAVLALLAQPGTRGPNTYGPDPLHPVAESMREHADEPSELTSSMGNRRIGSMLIFVAVVVVAVIGVSFMLFSPGQDGEESDLTTILVKAENGEIASITVDGDRLLALTRANQSLTATKEPGTGIFEVLQSAGINPVERGIAIEVRRSSDLANPLRTVLSLLFFGAVLAGIAIVAYSLLRRG